MGAPLLRDDIEEGTLQIAEFYRGAHRLHVELLDHVDDGLGARHALTWTREIRPVDQKRVLVHGRSEHRYGVDRTARRRRRGYAGRIVDETEHGIAARRHGPDELRAESRLDAARSRVDIRVRADRHGFGDARYGEDDDPLDGVAATDGDRVFAMRGESGRRIDGQGVGAGRQNRKSPLASVAGRRLTLTANERRRGDADRRARDGAAVGVLDTADKRPR